MVHMQMKWTNTASAYKQYKYNIIRGNKLITILTIAKSTRLFLNKTLKTQYNGRRIKMIVSLDIVIFDNLVCWE